MNTLRTRRLTLEPQIADHAEAMFAVLSDPAIYAYENDPPKSIDWLRERFVWLEPRASPDGRERWLNWVIRKPQAGLIGYVQATVYPDGHAGIAYILQSAHWGQGFACEATIAMLSELTAHYQVIRFNAVLKRENRRSLHLLERLGFIAGSNAEVAAVSIDPDELVMTRAA